MIGKTNITGGIIKSDYLTPFIDNTLSEIENNIDSLRSGIFMQANLTKATFPMCKSVGQNAFQGCSVLSEIYLPECEYLEGAAFQSCYSLKSINLPKLKKIKNSFGLGNLFDYCLNLTEINFPLIEEIDAYAFGGNCPNLQKINLPNCKFISGFFSYCSSLNSVSFPKCEVFKMSLHSCSNLEKVYMPNCTVLSGWYPFNSCSNLNTIITSHLTYICDYAFRSCSNLQNDILIDKNCKYIGENAFTNCNKNPFSSLSYISLPECTYIGKSCCNHNLNLININCPKLTALGQTTFNNCSNLKQVYAPYLHRIQSEAFAHCWNLETVEADISSVDQYAFQNCYNLKNINLEKCYTIPYGCFQNCSLLSEVYLKNLNTNNNNTFFGNDAFYGCQNLSQIFCYFNPKNFNSKIYSLNSIFQSTPLTDSSYLGYYGSIYVPAKYINDFKNLFNLSEFDSRISSLSSQCDVDYVYCGEFRTSYLNNIPEEKKNCKYVLNAAFESNSFSEVILSNCLTVGYNAFYSCVNLQYIDLPNCVKIESCAFAFCSRISSINLPKVEELGFLTFSRCYNLTNVNLPKCKKIDMQTFSPWDLHTLKMSELEEIDGYGNLTYQNLYSFYLLGSKVPKINQYYVWSNINDFFSMFTPSLKVYVRESMVSAFQVADMWSNHMSQIIGLTDEEIAALE